MSADADHSKGVIATMLTPRNVAGILQVSEPVAREWMKGRGALEIGPKPLYRIHPDALALELHAFAPGELQQVSQAVPTAGTRVVLIPQASQPAMPRELPTDWLSKPLGEMAGMSVGKGVQSDASRADSPRVNADLDIP